MADTYGLMKTRKEYNEALVSGDTQLSHKDWYEERMKQEEMKKRKEEKPTLASLMFK